MKFFDQADATSQNQALLEDYDRFIGSRLGPNYSYPLRLRDWELYETFPYLKRKPGGARILETGAFTTYLGMWLTQYSDEVIVTDLLRQRLTKNILRRCGVLRRKPLEVPFERWYLAMRRASPKIRLRQIDLTRMPFPDDHFDYITSISVVEHIPRIESALSEMYRCLKPGGYLLLTTDCSPEGKPFDRGVRYFTEAELEDLFRSYPDVSEHRPADFRRENWCYYGDKPLLTAFVAIQKPPEAGEEQVEIVHDA